MRRQPDPYWRPDPYTPRDQYRREGSNYCGELHHCRCCKRKTSWIGAGRRDPAILVCTDCGTDQRFA